MKRTEIPKCNRIKNKSILNHINRNIVYPSLFFNPVLLNEEITSGVEIIEINDEEAETEQQETIKSAENSWFNKYDSLRNDYEINRSIKQERRIKHDQKYETSYTYSGNAFDQAYAEFYDIDCRGDRNYSKQLPTVISNEVSSDTSSGDIEVIQSDSSLNDSYNSHKMYKARKTPVTYFDKNRQDFHENGNFLNNTGATCCQAQSTSSSSYTDDEREKDFVTIRRIATPNTIYIARLNLPSSPTLPTVTEVTEPKKSLEMTGSNSKLYKKSNSWCNSEPTVRSDQNKQKLSTLSERERRRKRLKEIQERRTERLESGGNLQINFNNEVVMQNSINFKINDDKITSVEESRNIEPYIVNKLEKDMKISPSKSTEKNSNTIKETEKISVDNDNENFEAIEVFDYDLDYSRDKQINSPNRLLSKNMSVVKPNSLQDKGSVPSLHLTFNTDADEERKSCLKRLLQCIKCCK